MNVSELQNDIIRFVLNTTNVSILEKAKILFKTQQLTEDWWDEISDHEKEMVEEGAKDIEEGRVVPWEKVREETQKL
ncbi:MAG TPA: hypothetical protein ENJ95_07690 [Bacteroidetes bacterium]|nr:hypothetical protein [Bacteroidota bacterium]